MSVFAITVTYKLNFRVKRKVQTTTSIVSTCSKGSSIIWNTVDVEKHIEMNELFI